MAGIPKNILFVCVTFLMVIVKLVTVIETRADK